MTASEAAREPTPAALKIPLNWTPEWPAMTCDTGFPTAAPALKIWKLTDAEASLALYAPALVRKPRTGPPFLTEVRTEFACDFEELAPAMNIPTVGTGAVE